MKSSKNMCKDDLLCLNQFVKIVKDAKRVGRGHGAGTGKTCCRGVSGQKSRSGAAVSPLFIGGQSPFQRTTPKLVRMNSHRPKVYEITSYVLLSKCKKLLNNVFDNEAIKIVINKLNVPFKFKFVKIVGDMSELPFKSRLIKIDDFKIK